MSQIERHLTSNITDFADCDAEMEEGSEKRRIIGESTEDEGLGRFNYICLFARYLMSILQLYYLMEIY